MLSDSEILLSGNVNTIGKTDIERVSKIFEKDNKRFRTPTSLPFYWV